MFRQSSAGQRDVIFLHVIFLFSLKDIVLIWSLYNRLIVQNLRENC